MAETNELLPFSVLNEAIQTYLPDPAIADTKFFNLYKVYQHALTYTLNNAEKKKFRHYLNAPLSIQVTRYALKGLRRKHQKPLQKTLIYDDNRYVIGEDRNYYSFYFSKTQELLDRSDYSLIQKADGHGRGFDFTLSDFASAGNMPLDHFEVEVLKEVNRLAKKAKSIPLPGFTDYLYPALQLFFEFFHRYYWAFKDQSIERLLFICHYHNESLIAACKVLGIEVIEYQHGLISKNDLYYVYPKAIEAFRYRCLFPDKIVVFGNFWRETLLQGYEFSADQIHVGGNISLSPDLVEIDRRISKDRAILIGTQKNMATAYVDYLIALQQTLASRHPDWKLLIKLHPAEPEPNKYDVFKSYPNCEVHGKTSSLNHLLERSAIQISIYSTTLYDAIGYGVLNFALQNYSSSSDYAAEMVENQVAFPIEFSDDPIERYLHFSPQKDKLLTRERLYSPFRADVITSLLSE